MSKNKLNKIKKQINKQINKNKSMQFEETKNIKQIKHQIIQKHNKQMNKQITKNNTSIFKKRRRQTKSMKNKSIKN